MKKVISVLTAVLMLFTMMIPAFAAEKEGEATESYDGMPVIIVRGIDFAGLTYEDGSKALSVNAGDITSILFKALISKFVFKQDEAIAEGIFEVAESVLSPIACDNNGNSVEEVSMVQYPGSMANYPEFAETLTDEGEMGIVKTAIEKYGAENTYFFTYDWRKTPAELADELSSFVETAKSDSGKAQVNIICASMGGMVTTAYMYYYGTESINSAVYLSGAQNGTYVCGDALNGRILFDKDVIIELVGSLTDNNIFLKIILTVFDAVGVLDYITGALNDFTAKYFDKANDIVLRDCMGTLCGFWSLCPDDDYDSAIETIFGGHEADYEVLLSKLEDTKEFVFSTEETLLNAKESGVKLSFVSNYNTGLVPVYERAYLNGDMVLETELTSNFATVAPLGKTLSEEYLANADSAYISPDKVIDASTALFKDNTWFVKDAPHVAADYGTEFSNFTFTLLESEVQPTVDTFGEYPQFMIADDTLSLSPLQ